MWHTSENAGKHSRDAWRNLCTHYGTPAQTAWTLVPINHAGGKRAEPHLQGQSECTSNSVVFSGFKGIN